MVKQTEKCKNSITLNITITIAINFIQDHFKEQLQKALKAHSQGKNTNYV